MKSIVIVAIALVLVGNAQGQQKGKGEAQVPEEPLCRFTAKVKWIEIVGNREGEAVPIGTQPELNWLVGIDILSIEKAAKLFDKKGEEMLLIHSPAMMFSGRPIKKVIGKQYSFKVFGELKDGAPRYSHAEVVETNRPRKK
jgi:hypothetical protein